MANTFKFIKNPTISSGC